MKQIENRIFTDCIKIAIYPTFKEKIKILFSNRILLNVDLDVNSDNGIIEKQEQLKTR